MTRLEHIDHLNTARFITFTCYKRRKLLVDPTVIGEFINTLNLMRERFAIRILGYVVMPEHVHVVLHPPEGAALGPVIGWLKGYSARVILARYERELLRSGSPRSILRNNGCAALWQRRCYDHNCRNPEAVLEKIEYCHRNPVTRGLVNDPGDWRWSSCNWYQGRQDVPLEMDVATLA